MDRNAAGRGLREAREGPHACSRPPPDCRAFRSKPTASSKHPAQRPERRFFEVFGWCRAAGHPVGLPDQPASVAVTAAPLADHTGRIAAALEDLTEAQEAEERLLHEARRIATEMTHHRTGSSACKQIAFVLAETHADAGLT